MKARIQDPKADLGAFICWVKHCHSCHDWEWCHTNYKSMDWGMVNMMTFSLPFHVMFTSNRTDHIYGFQGKILNREFTTVFFVSHQIFGGKAPGFPPSVDQVDVL